MTANDFNDVDYAYNWQGEDRHGVIAVSVAESGNTGHVNLLVAREIAKELRRFDKIVLLNERQITVDWAARSYVPSSVTTITAQAWGEPFQIAVYDAILTRR